MKNFIIELRKLITTLLMGLAFRVMPDCEFKKKYTDFMLKELMNF